MDPNGEDPGPKMSNSVCQVALKTIPTNINDDKEPPGALLVYYLPAPC